MSYEIYRKICSGFFCVCVFLKDFSWILLLSSHLTSVWKHVLHQTFQEKGVLAEGSFNFEKLTPDLILPCRLCVDAVWSGKAAARLRRSFPMQRSREPGAAGGVKEAAAGPPEPPRRARGADTPHGPPGFRLSGLVSWRRRPCWSCALFAAANAVFW